MAVFIIVRPKIMLSSSFKSGDFVFELLTLHQHMSIIVRVESCQGKGGNMALSMDLASVRPKVGSEILYEMNATELSLLPVDWRLVSPVQVSGSIYPEEHEMLMSGIVKVIMETSCSLCLKKIETRLEVPFSERLLYVLDAPYLIEEDETIGDLEEIYWIYDKIEYDFESMIVDVILNALPTRPLCAVDCKGLCDNCGQDLNKGTCSCHTTEIDPRWAKLAQLQDGEVE